MKTQRKDISTASSHVTVRQKKAGLRFEVLINRSAYHQQQQQQHDNHHKKESREWDLKEVVDEIFTNAAKLTPADKNELDKAFPDKKSKAEIIIEILERGEAQLSEVDRAEQTAAQSELFSKVAEEVAKVALMEKVEDTIEEIGPMKHHDSGKKKKHNKHNNDDDDADEDTSTNNKSSSASKMFADPFAENKKLVHVSKDIVEREMKNARFKLLSSNSSAAASSMNDQVNAAFFALSKNSATVQILRNQCVWVINAPSNIEGIEKAILTQWEKSLEGKPYKILQKVTENKKLSITILAPFEFTGTDLYQINKDNDDIIKYRRKPETHVPTSDEDDLSKIVPFHQHHPATSKNNNTHHQKEEASAMVAHQSTSAQSIASQNNNSGGGGSKAKKSAKKNNSKNAAVAPDSKKKTHGDLDAELAAFSTLKTKKKKKGSSSSSDDSDEDSEDEATVIPTMMTKHKKRI